jgi:hypothetical protein
VDDDETKACRSAAARALDHLESAGYIILRERSYRQAQTEHAIRRSQVAWAEREAEHAERWARDCLAQERRAGDRCTFLYGLAASLGATREQLRGDG